MKKGGFTLIELLVVIAIIAILAAILFPVFAQAREEARTISCLSNVKQLNLGMQMYTTDYDEHFPHWNWNFFCNGGNAGAPRDSAAFWTMAIYPYVKNFGIYQCPDDVLNWDDAWANCSDDGGRNDLFGPFNPITGQGCNFWDDCNPHFVSYALNEWLTGGNTGNALAGIPQVARTFMLADSASQLSGTWADYSGNSANGIAARLVFSNEGCCDEWNMDYWTASQILAQRSESFIETMTRHHAGDNVTFVDGHAKWLRWSALTIGNLEPQSRPGGT